MSIHVIFPSAGVLARNLEKHLDTKDIYLTNKKIIEFIIQRFSNAEIPFKSIRPLLGEQLCKANLGLSDQGNIEISDKIFQALMYSAEIPERKRAKL
jgi:hypothetical protein